MVRPKVNKVSLNFEGKTRQRSQSTMKFYFLCIQNMAKRKVSFCDHGLKNIHLRSVSKFCGTAVQITCFLWRFRLGGFDKNSW